jgi:glucose-1-phosphate adenylyltransferase
VDKVLGVINLMNEHHFLKELTSSRCMASVPFSGRYRLIDFTLSSFFNAGISQVGVFAKENYRSLMDHLGSGKEWDLDRHTGGLFILPPVHPDKIINGDIQQFHDHIEFFKRTNADTIIITPGHLVCKMDFAPIIARHRETGADLTVFYKKYNGQPVEKPVYHKCLIDESNQITDIELYTTPKIGDPVCLETYVVSKSLFIDLVEKCLENSEYSFLKDVVKTNLGTLHIQGYEFTGTMPFIHSIESYFSSNMEFLKPEVIHSFFNDTWKIYTKIKHEPPVKYSCDSKVSHSLIANGCDIQGFVENSIIFRGVKVKKGATVKNSIIMQKSEIEEGAYVENAIADKQVKITRHKVVKGSGRPRVLKKREII